MSQFDFGTIDPNSKSGPQLALDLNKFRDALNSGHRGSARPAYAQAGMQWVRETSSTQWDLMLFDGDTDFVLRSVNPATNTLLGIPQSQIEGLSNTLSDMDSKYIGKDSTTGAAILPSGTTAQRPASPVVGMIRYNTTYSEYERYQGGAWVLLNAANKAFNEAAIVTLPSAASVGIGAASSNTINISGVTTITAFDAPAAGAIRRLVFQGALTLTHNAASLILPGAANITTSPGDTAEFVSLGGGNWRCFNYQRAAGPVFSKEYISSPQTIVAGGGITLAHGLGVKPKLIQVYLVCAVATGNWAVGDEVFYQLDFEQSNAAAQIYGYTLKKDAINLALRISVSGIFLQDPVTTAFISPAIVASNFKLVAQGWA